MSQDQIIKALRLIQRWLADGDFVMANLDLKHLLNTIDPDALENGEVPGP